MNQLVFNERVSALTSVLSLSTPLSFLSGNGTGREIAVIVIRDEAGISYYGEISPLPGFSVETLNHSLSELETIVFSIPPLEDVEYPLPPGWRDFLRGVHCPSLRCGLEGAILDYLAKNGFLTNSSIKHATIECNGFIVAEAESEIRREVIRRCEQGFRTLKIKISPKSVESTIRALRTSNLQAPTRIRLDANRSFTSSEWAAVVGDLKSLPIEYVEEPVNIPDTLPSIIDSGLIPIAIDETARDTAPEQWLRWGVRAVVLKPSINGGLLSLLPLISLIESNGAYVTLSSSFESGVGLRSIALFSSLLNTCAAIGVDTASFLKEDLVEPPFPRSTPNLIIKELISIQYIGDNR